MFILKNSDSKKEVRNNTPVQFSHICPCQDQFLNHLKRQTFVNKPQNCIIFASHWDSDDYLNMTIEASPMKSCILLLINSIKILQYKSTKKSQNCSLSNLTIITYNKGSMISNQSCVALTIDLNKKMVGNYQSYAGQGRNEVVKLD